MVDNCIIPECYVDTNLIETLVPPSKKPNGQRGYNHQKGCGTVSSRMKKEFKDSFALGIIDKDKKDINYLSECILIVSFQSLHLFKHQTKHHYIIQIAPAVEIFFLTNAKQCGLYIEDYKLPETLPELKRISKSVRSKEDIRFKSLFKNIFNSGSEEFKVLANWIVYLKEHTYYADLNELKKL